MRAGGVAPGRTVEDATTGQPVEPIDVKLPPGHAAGEDRGPGRQDVAAVQVDLVGRRIDPGDAARDEDLRPEPTRLLEGPAPELVPREALGEAEVVLDP